jgi:hypothetical protein
MYFLDKENFINNLLKVIVDKAVKYFRMKLKKDDYDQAKENLKNKLNKMSKEKLSRWKDEKRTRK